MRPRVVLGGLIVAVAIVILFAVPIVAFVRWPLETTAVFVAFVLIEAVALIRFLIRRGRERRRNRIDADAEFERGLERIRVRVERGVGFPLSRR